MIREWTLKEAQTDDRLAVFLKAFEMATSVVKVDSDYAFQRYMKMMEAGICRIFVDEDEATKELHGAIGFIVSNDLHDGTKTAIETFWFAHPDFRGCGKALFRKFEEVAAGIGCKKLAMIHLVDSYPDTLKVFYEKNGYRLIECHYAKDL